MTVDQMRRIDYWLGRPLCFFVSLLLRVQGWVQGHVDEKAPRVVMIGLSEMGSIVLADPMMRKLSDDYELYFLTMDRSRPSLALTNRIADDHIFVIREDSLWHFIADIVLFIFWARKHSITASIDIELFSRVSALLSGLSGATKRVGFSAFYSEGLYRGSIATHPVLYNSHIHISHNFLSLAHALTATVLEKPYAKVAIDKDQLQLQIIKINSPEIRRIQSVMTRYVAPYSLDSVKVVLFNTEGSDLLPQRRWPIEYYTELIQLVVAHADDVVILLTGSRQEKERIQRLSDAVDSDRCINFAGAIEFEDLLALYHVSEFMLTNDSGPNHFAALTLMPTYTFFGPETPKLYGSLGKTTAIYANFACSPCVSAANHRKTPCIDNVCLQAIKPKQVFELIQSALIDSRFDRIH